MPFEAWVLWLAAALLAHTYLLYPLLVRAWGALRPRRTATPAGAPVLTVVVVAYNEAGRIRARIDNLSGLDYPRDRLEIVVASDGSTDGTAERARGHESVLVRVLEFGTRRGKPAVLNDVVPRARGEIVVFADARQRFDPQALRRLVAPFADPSVGAVGGELILTADTAPTPIGEGVGLYWRYEKFMRRSESRVDSTVGVSGAIYAIRRDLFEPLAEDTLLDDVLIPMRIVRRGYRVLFEPGARAYDRPPARPGEEFARKVRTLAGNFQLLSREPWLLSPARNRLWFQTVSHKVLRLLSPLLLMTCFAANLGLLGRPFYAWMMGAQCVFYLAALSGCAFRGAGPGARLLTVPYTICLLSWATLVGFCRFATGRQRVTWERAAT